MKSIALIIAAALAAPLVANAQTNQPLTRAQVRANLIAVEQAGYWPARGADPHYPDDAQAAINKVAAQHANGLVDTAIGGATDGTSQAGAGGDLTVSSYSPPIRTVRFTSLADHTTGNGK